MAPVIRSFSGTRDCCKKNLEENFQFHLSLVRTEWVCGCVTLPHNTLSERARVWNRQRKHHWKKIRVKYQSWDLVQGKKTYLTFTMGPDCGWAFSRSDAWKRIPSGHTVEAKILKVKFPKKWENWVRHLGGAILILLLNIIISTVEAKKNVAVPGGTIGHFQKKNEDEKYLLKLIFERWRKIEKIIYQFWWGPSDSSLKFSPDFKSRGESEWSHPSGIVHHSRKEIQKKIFCKCGLRPSSLSRLYNCFVY